jgi:hypothetical protein
MSALPSLLVLLAAAPVQEASEARHASLDDVLESRFDLWGDEALRDGMDPGFDSFASLLPPPRYVDAAFRVVPIVLGAPDAAIKGRWIADGSGVNLRARASNWRDPGRCPVAFEIGGGDAAPVRFGADPDRLDGPHLVDGWLPIVALSDRAGEAVVRQEVFAALSPPAGTEDAALCVRFALADGERAPSTAASPAARSRARLRGASTRTATTPSARAARRTGAESSAAARC